MIKTYITDAGRIGNGFIDERSDCAIRAYSIAYQIPYYEAHKLFTDLGRKRRHSTSSKMIHTLCPYGISLGWQPITIKAFIANHPSGKFYCYNRSHAFAIIDGIVFDDRRHTGHTKIYWYSEVKK